jgi:hypothetical protein
MREADSRKCDTLGSAFCISKKSPPTWTYQKLIEALTRTYQNITHTYPDSHSPKKKSIGGDTSLLFSLRGKSPQTRATGYICMHAYHSAMEEFSKVDRQTKCYA